MYGETVNWKKVVSFTLQTIEEIGGIFLVSKGIKSRENLMTIGWVQMGVIWGEPIATVLVRPSRHTFTLLEENGEFTIAVPSPSLSDAIALCGRLSGRDTDKFVEANLTPWENEGWSVPGVQECPVNIFCRVVHKTRVDPKRFHPSLVEEYYPRGDFHTIYFGRIEITAQSE